MPAGSLQHEGSGSSLRGNASGSGSLQHQASGTSLRSDGASRSGSLQHESSGGSLPAEPCSPQDGSSQAAGHDPQQQPEPSSSQVVAPISSFALGSTGLRHGVSTSSLEVQLSSAGFPRDGPSSSLLHSEALQGSLSSSLQPEASSSSSQLGLPQDSLSSGLQPEATGSSSFVAPALPAGGGGGGSSLLAQASGQLQEVPSFGSSAEDAAGGALHLHSVCSCLSASAVARVAA